MTNRRWARLGASALTVASLLALGSGSAAAAPPTIVTKRIATVGSTTAVLEAEVTTGGKATKYHFEYDTTEYKEGEGQHGTSTPTGELLAPESPKTVKATIEGLKPGTTYHFRAVASNPSEAKSADRAFTTYALPLGVLPDERAYEQASPIDKNGGDALGPVPFVKAAFDGNGITYGSTSGIPGGVGAQELPLYLASRTGEGPEAQWQTQGLLPPQDLGAKAGVLGWTPDFTRVYQLAVRFGAANANQSAVFERRPDGEEIEVAPYVPKASYAFAGASGNGTEAILESRPAQPGTTPAAAEKRPFVYAWDAEEEKLSLASVFNKETEGSGGVPANGAFAGPYEWVRGRTSEGGDAAFYYTQQERAVAEDGSVFFTTAGDGHIYLRQHPTQSQSTMEGEVCKEAAKACTIDVSASQRTTPDAAGSRPAAFQAASADGKAAFFTSSQKLTDDANTGPEVEAPTIGRLELKEEEAKEVLGKFLEGHHAVGVAVAGECLYWADPSEGSIGRAKLGPGGPEHVEPQFITPPETEFETHPQTEPGVKHPGPAIPRYVSVQGEYVYWTNTGPLGGDANHKQLEGPVVGAGTIGRAKLAGPDCGALEAESIEAEFIKGASDPQGIAVNASHIYWGNSLKNEFVNETDIARAKIDGAEVEQHFHSLNNLVRPFGLALSPSYVYFVKEEVGGFGTVNRIPLEGGGGEEYVVVSTGGKPRGIAIAGPHVYWATQAGEEIGRLPIADFAANPHTCGEAAGCEPEFLKVGGLPTGLTADPAESHLYWSANGEVPPHPGNDLYHYEVEGKTLTDITVDTADPNGAEVQGVLGASENGGRVYFVANGVLATNKGAKGEQASKGDCEGRIGENLSGHCNLYLWEAGATPKGEVTFITRLGAGDDFDWVPMINSGSVRGVQKTSLASPDGATLLFSSQQSPTAYDSGGTAELYLYRVGRGITCVSCDPTGAAPEVGGPSLGSINPSALRPNFSTVTASRNLADEGRRVFFETPDRLVAEDVNGTGAAGCPAVGSEIQEFPACMDVYEWEAPGAGSCTESAPSYSSQDEGCLYLISSGKSDWASLFGDASESGKDVFFFTREGLVGQDKDELLDVYDAKEKGGIPAQSPPEKFICESAESCHGAVTPPAPEAAAGSATFVGPSNPAPKHAKPKKHKAKKHKGKKHKAKPHGRRAGADGRASR